MPAFLAIVQTITTQWTKVSRGAPGAVQRNQTASTLRLPTEAGSGEVAWHEVRFVEPNFELEQRLHSTTLGRVSAAIGGLDLGNAEGQLVVDVFGRHQFSRLPGQLGVLTFNWVDDVIEDGWRTSVYRKVVARVGHRLE